MIPILIISCLALAIAIFILPLRIYRENTAISDKSMYRIIKATTKTSYGDKEVVYIIQEKCFIFLVPRWRTKKINGIPALCCSNNESAIELYNYIVGELKIM